MQLGFIGTGNMGNPMALHLIEVGHALQVHDQRAEATTSLEEAGAQRVESPMEAAQGAAAVFLSLPKPADVEQVVLGKKGVLEGLERGGVVVDMTTNSPSVVRRLAESTRARGIEFLDAPVSGGVGGARRGTLAVMVGGDLETYERCEPLLRAIGSNVFRVGDVGAGNVAKARQQHARVHQHDGRTGGARAWRAGGRRPGAAVGGRQGKQREQLWLGARHACRAARPALSSKLHRRAGPQGHRGSRRSWPRSSAYRSRWEPRPSH